MNSRLPAVVRKLSTIERLEVDKKRKRKKNFAGNRGTM